MTGRGIDYEWLTVQFRLEDLAAASAALADRIDAEIAKMCIPTSSK